jgi:hypothetical protein
MSVLWIAFGLYIVGVAVVLYLRPEGMFRDDGRWKEFGVGTGKLRTVFPFWLFTLVWAVLSYSLATAGALFVGQVAAIRPELPTKGFDILPAAAAAPLPPAINSIAAPISATAAAAPTGAFTTPGYYVLQTPTTDIPRYVYYGTSPPSAVDVARLSTAP